MKTSIPNREAWGDFKSDPELRTAFKVYGGKNVDDATPLFVTAPIQRAQELRYAPQAVFNYYIFCFANYLITPASAGESDMASCFLGLLVDKSKKDPASLAPIYPSLSQSVEVVAGRQTFYDADYNIYGSFAEKKAAIEANLGKGS